MHKLLVAVLLPVAGVLFGTAQTEQARRPTLPAEPYAYADAHYQLPVHFQGGLRGPLRGVLSADNTPADNPITDEGATLGRVLFYDVRLSAGNTVSCGTCHRQEFGFSDPERLSVGIRGQTTDRHSMALANARYYPSGRFFWDERAATLEEQVLEPVQSQVEMGLTLPELETKLSEVDFYGPLFLAAFGTPEVTSERVIRSMVSYQSKFDRALEQAARRDGVMRRRGPPLQNFGGVLTEEEERGLRLFAHLPRDMGRSVGCDQCHGTVTQILDRPRNNGLDDFTTDAGAGGARFKAPALRNIAVRAPYMHDGRFETLREVVEFYNTGVQAHPDLDPVLRTRGGEPRRLGLGEADIDALVAFLETLTDEAFLTHPKFSDPFRD
jgi:cytochrome c peroxidase